MERKLLLIVATGNSHKLTEFREIFSSVCASAPEVLSEAEAARRYFPEARTAYTAPAETGRTFAANAFLKAEGIYRYLKTRLPSVPGTDLLIAADDSGLCVEALDGAPGVLSARYASADGENASDTANVEKLLREMESVPDDRRRASFVCALSAILIRGADLPVALLRAEGHLPGMIARTPRGTHGFGYDPVLYLPEYGKCVAELEPEEKNRISHRGKALRQLANQYYGIY